MKTSTFYSIFLTFLALLPLSSTGHASPPINWTHSCQPLDHDQWEQNLARGPATKQLVNTDQLPTVRLVYFLPNDRTFNSDVVDSIKARMPRIQTFFRDQMQAHEYGNKTFQFETDDQGEPRVHRVDGPNSDSSYLRSYRITGPGNVLRDLRQTFAGNNILFIVVDHSTGDNLGWGNIAGFGGSRGKNSGYALLPHNFSFRTAAHELGHAFGLKHDFNDDANIMSYGLEPNQLSACSTGFLAGHPYFNPDIPVINPPRTITITSGDSQFPTFELISPFRYPAGSTNISLQFRVKASVGLGLHQVLFLLPTKAPHPAAGSLEVKACQILAGENEAVVTFNYDGIIPSEGSESFSSSATQYLVIATVDTLGNMTSESLRGYFTLAEDSPHHLATISRATNKYALFYGAKFSPDGTILAVRSSYGIQIWDTATRTAVTTLPGRTNSISFSPDGTILANGSGTPSEANITLWDMTNHTLIATLEGHQGGPTGVHSVAFSPDGTILASGAGDQTIKLWNVASRTHLATLQGHTSHVWSVAFSSDGTLASGSRDGKVKLWDVTTRTNIATLEGNTGRVLDVAFSPDGTLLASSTDGQMVLLWDVATRTQVGTLRGHGKPSFSSDGQILVTGAGLGEVRLWDVESRKNIARFGHPGRAWDNAGLDAEGVFSPDGSLLASTVVYGVELWNASEWVGTTPVTSATTAATDFNGDGKTDFVDFFLFADAYGGTDPQFDLDGSGTVDFVDFFKFIDAFGS